MPVPQSLYARLSEGMKKLEIVPLLKAMPDDEYLRKKDEYTFSFEQDKEVGEPPKHDK